MTTVAARLRAWNEGLDDPVDVRSLAVLRLAIGPIVLLHLSPFIGDALDGVIYSDHFTLPYWSWYPELPHGAYVALLWATATAAVLLSAGLWTRVVAWLTVGGVAYNLFLSQTHFHHNRAFLLILLVGLAVLPSGRTVSLDARRARRRGAPLSPVGGTRLALTVLRFGIALVYFASGFSKLVDPDWWGGTVTRLRVERYEYRLVDAGVPDGLIDLLSDPGFQAIGAKVVVLTELFIGIGLLVPRLRMAAVWFAIPFHVSIQLTAVVQTFSVAALAALVVWADRPSRDRLIEVGQGWHGVLRGLDWTGRFRLVDSSDGLVVEDGERRREGRGAGWFVASRLPLTFWLAAPVLLARSFPAVRRPGRLGSRR
ncbi:MAG: HTTM domain-containing protein [Acidimicrobiales bacterium]